MFALKASEKVNNLSNELDKLSVFLQRSPDSSDYDSLDQALLSKDLRIESAIHIISTLKSVNDGSLSDWQGVIGEELEAQKEEKEEREQDLRNLIDRIEALYLMNMNTYSNEKGQGAEFERMKLQTQVDSLKNDINMLLTQVSGYPTRRKKTEKTSSECPVCKNQVQYINRQSSKAKKGINCSQCKTRLFTVYSDGKSHLKVREPINELVNCPQCDKANNVALDPLSGSRITLHCNSCNSKLETVRTTNGVIVRLPKSQVVSINSNEDFIKEVKDLLPPQPWSKGIHREVAEKLGISPSKVGRAITILIERGIFKNQVDGIVNTEKNQDISS